MKNVCGIIYRFFLREAGAAYLSKHVNELHLQSYKFLELYDLITQACWRLQKKYYHPKLEHSTISTARSTRCKF